MKTALVTGASTGIGREIARGLLRAGLRVVVACRDEARGGAALADLSRDGAAELMLVDLASQASIRDFAARFLAAHSALHVLVNNAGILSLQRRVSPDGIELTWATNVVAYHLLTELLGERLRASAPARVVNVVSTFARGLDLDDVQFERRRFVGAAVYAQSKQADRLLTWAQAERFAGSGVTVNAVHPGMVRSELGRDGRGVRGAVVRTFFRVFGRSTTAGAETAVWLAHCAEVEGVTGELWHDHKRLRCRFRDAAAQARLVQILEAMVR